MQMLSMQPLDPTSCSTPPTGRPVVPRIQQPPPTPVTAAAAQHERRNALSPSTLGHPSLLSPPAAEAPNPPSPSTRASVSGSVILPFCGYPPGLPLHLPRTPPILPAAATGRLLPPLPQPASPDGWGIRPQRAATLAHAPSPTATPQLLQRHPIAAATVRIPSAPPTATSNCLEASACCPPPPANSCTPFPTRIPLRLLQGHQRPPWRHVHAPCGVHHVVVPGQVRHPGAGRGGVRALRAMLDSAHLRARSCTVRSV